MATLSQNEHGVSDRRTSGRTGGEPGSRVTCAWCAIVVTAPTNRRFHNMKLVCDGANGSSWVFRIATGKQIYACFAPKIRSSMVMVIMCVFHEALSQTILPLIPVGGEQETEHGSHDLGCFVLYLMFFLVFPVSGTREFWACWPCVRVFLSSDRQTHRSAHTRTDSRQTAYHKQDWYCIPFTSSSYRRRAVRRMAWGRDEDDGTWHAERLIQLSKG